MVQDHLSRFLLLSSPPLLAGRRFFGFHAKRTRSRTTNLTVLSYFTPLIGRVKSIDVAADAVPTETSLHAIAKMASFRQKNATLKRNRNADVLWIGSGVLFRTGESQLWGQFLRWTRKSDPLGRRFRVS